MKTAEQTGNHLRYLATMTFAAVAAWRESGHKAAVGID
jgi:hypothetical protein